MDEGTDTGPNFPQKAVEVKEGDTPRRRGCGEFMKRGRMGDHAVKAIDLIANDKIEVVDGLVRSR